MLPKRGVTAMKMHAFVVMPFGIKDEIDFDRVYAEFIKPAVEAAGLEAFRADEEVKAGDIRRDMFQELLLADLVIVDASIDNPNVWYELGVRHALRERDVIVIACREGRLPFDIATDRVLRYHRNGGTPAPATLQADHALLTKYICATIEARRDDNYQSSPVYNLLPGLQEPDWRSLAVKGASNFWSTYDAWCMRIEVARRNSRAGDVLALADETPTWALHGEALRTAGAALTKLNQFGFALEQYEMAYAIDAKDRESRQKIGVLMGRLGCHEEAREWIEKIMESYPNDPQGYALMGRVEKDEWISRWRVAGATINSNVDLAKSQEALLDASITQYVKAFSLDPRHFYSGINALTLCHLQRHLGGDIGASVNMDALVGAVTWASGAALAKCPNDYWARVTQADAQLLADDLGKAVKAYRFAVATADKDWFALDSSRQQLCILRDLGFRAEVINAAIAIFDQELTRLTPPLHPRRVFLFSGHMIDKVGRADARFPPEMEVIVKASIDRKLDELKSNADDLAISGGACGGDLLFVEACLARGIPTEIYIPFDEPQFLQASVAFAGEAWIQRFRDAKAHPIIKLIEMPDRLGPVCEGANAHARNNRWMLYSALAHGPNKVRFISLWNGREGDGAGGTQDMVKTVQRHLGEVHILDAAAMLKQLRERS